MEVVWPFAGPYETWRNRELILNRNGNPSFSRSVKLGNHQPGENNCLLEFSGLHQSVTSSGRIHHQQAFVGRLFVVLSGVSV